MADAKSSKASTSRPTPPAAPTTVPLDTPENESPGAAARASAAEEDRTAHEPFWETGQRLYQALQKTDQEIRNRIVSAQQEQQERLWKVQVDAQRRAEDLWRDYWTTVNQAGEEDPQRVQQEALRKYQDALWDLQTNVRNEWEDAASSAQRTLTNLQELFQAERVSAFVAYKQAAQRAWARLDPNTLSCESLATIGQSLATAACLMGGRPSGS